MNTIIIDYRATEQEIFSLKNQGLKIIKTEKHPNLYEAIDGHPDIQVLPLDSEKIIIEKDASSTFISKLNKASKNVLKSHSSLGRKYPDNIFLNCVISKHMFIHNLKYTDKNIIPYIDDKLCINVKQGYTKCSTALISENALISSDPSIISAVKKHNIDVLALPPGDILLPGLNYGFIGGTCGLISENKLAFFGNLKYYPHRAEVMEFLIKHNVEPLFLYDGPLIDRGSILEI